MKILIFFAYLLMFFTCLLMFNLSIYFITLIKKNIQDRKEKDVPKSKKRSAGKQHKVAPIALPMDVSISQKALILALLRRSRS